MTEIKVRMAIDPFRVLGKALAGARKPIISGRVVSIDYDEVADILYVKFKHVRIVDNESLDNEGLIVASLDEQGEVAGLMIMEASRFAGAS